MNRRVMKLGMALLLCFAIASGSGCTAAATDSLTAPSSSGVSTDSPAAAAAAKKAEADTAAAEKVAADAAAAEKTAADAAAAEKAAADAAAKKAAAAAAAKKAAADAAAKKAAAAKSAQKERTVYITNTGSKYHADGCQYLSKSQIPVSLSQAQASYDACSRCNP